MNHELRDQIDKTKEKRESDIALILNAAKAAGYAVNLVSRIANSHHAFNIMIDGGMFFNPIDNDEDTFRLMVSCSLMVIIGDQSATVRHPLKGFFDDPMCFTVAFESESSSDRRKAVRLAITKAAAAIGENIE